MDEEEKQGTRKHVRNSVFAGNSLTETKNNIRNLFGLDFLRCDVEEYINYKYFKYSITQVKSKLEEKLKSPTFSLQDMTELMIHLQSATLLSSLTSPIITSIVHFQLIQEALGETMNANSNQKVTQVFQNLKTQLTPILMTKGEQLNQQQRNDDEPEFRNLGLYLLDYLTDYKTQFLVNPENLSWMLDTDIKNFERDPAVWKSEWKDKINNQTANSRHDQAVKNLEQEKLHVQHQSHHLPMRPEWEAILKKFAEPLTILHEVRNDMVILVVSKPVLVLSQCLAEVEKYLNEGVFQSSGNFLAIHEIHFVVAHVFYVDTSLDKKFWHGVNICVMAETVWCMSDNLCWNVSGRNGRDGVDIRNGGHQKGGDGHDGENGESGGNIVFLAKYYKNMEGFLLISNGGDGGSGQNGLNGEKGKDGKCMSLDELRDKFSSPVRWTGSDQLKCVQVVSNLRESSESFEVDKFYGVSESGHMTGAKFYGRWIYLKGVLSGGLKYEFSFSEGGILGSSCYLLVSGTRGSLGLPGGLGGHSGSGGYPGTIQVKLVDSTEDYKLFRQEREHGKPGIKNGEDGVRGDPGKDETDVGYSDNWHWSNVTFVEKGKYQIVTRSGTHGQPGTGDKVWCKFHDAYRSIESYKADAIVSQVTDRQIQLRNNAVIQKKTAIDMEKIFQVYSWIQKEVITSNHFQHGGTTTDNWEVASKIAMTPCEVTGNHVTAQFFRMPDDSMTSTSRRRPRRITQAHTSPTPSDIILNSTVKNERNAVFATLLRNHSHVINKYKESDKTKIGFVQHPTVTGPDSALHSIFGRKNTVTGEFSVEAPMDVRASVVQKLFEWFEHIQYLDEEVKEALKFSLTSIRNGRGRTDNFQELEMYTSQDLKYFLDFYEQQISTYRGTFNWNSLMGQKKVLYAYATFLSVPSISFLKSDLVLVSKARRVPLFFLDNHTLENGVPEPLVYENLDCEVEGRIIVTMDWRGNYSRVSSVTSRDTSLIQPLIIDIMRLFLSPQVPNEETFRKSLSSLLLKELAEDSPEVEHYTAMLQLWPPSLLQLLLHFSSAGSQAVHHPSVKMIFDAISHSLVEKDMNEASPFIFILVAHPQSEWSIEMFLIYIQKLYGFSNTTWYKTMLNKFPNLLLLQLVRFITASVTAGEFHDASSEPRFQKFLATIDTKYGPFDDSWEFTSLEGLDSSYLWYHQLSKLQVTSQLRSIPGEEWDNDKNKFNKAFYYFYHVFDSNPAQAMEMLQLYSGLKIRAIRSEDPGSSVPLSSILSKFHAGTWRLSKDTMDRLRNCENLQDWEVVLNSTDQGLWDLSKLIVEDKTTTIPRNIIENIILCSNTQTGLNQILTSTGKPRTEFNIVLRSWISDFHNKMKASGHKDAYIGLICGAIQMVDNVIETLLGHRLRETQKVTILAALLAPINQERKKNLLAQVRTGEGKSWIVLAVAIVRGLLKQKTDIVTSSSVLAQRDAFEYREVYEAFDLTVGHVTMDRQQERAREYQKTVVYGEVSHFQRDYLIDHFYNQNVRGSRDFQNIIIDEVDSMLLDKGNSVLYLSHIPAGLDNLEHILLFIWNTVLNGVNQDTFEPLEIHDAVIKSISLNSDEDPEECVELHCPNYLKPFVKLHLFAWIKSAYQATQLMENVHYTVHIDRFGSGGDANAKVVIMDLDTGTDLKESQWSDSLHQFLQLKHGCKLTSLSLKAVFVSNITFFKMYQDIFGLTGTLGTESDREFLVQTYETDLLVLPTSLPRLFSEEEPILCCTKSNWYEKVSKDAREKIDIGRSVLILCESVQDAETLFIKLCEENITRRDRILLYRRDFEPFPVVANGKKLEPGMLIIATNLAGRGTDIKLSDKLIRQGGLHVIFSYLPGSARVCWQGFGRAARCGDPGSGKLVFFVEEGDSSLNAIDYIIDQGQLEMTRVAEIRTYYDQVVFPEEELFKTFRDHCDEFGRKLDEAFKTFWKLFGSKNAEEKKTAGANLLAGRVNEVKELVKYQMLNHWAFWLDKKSTNLKNFSRAVPFSEQHKFYKVEEEELKQDFSEMIARYMKVTANYNHTAFQKLSRQIFSGRGSTGEGIEEHATGLIEEPALLIKLAKYYITTKEFDKALLFLRKVMDVEDNDSSFFSVVALYYDIYCQVKQGQFKNTHFLDDVRFCMDQLERMATLQLEIPHLIQDNLVVANQQIQVGKGLLIQKETTAKIFLTLKNSLENLIGKEGIEENDFTDIVQGHSDTAQLLLKQLLEDGHISLPRVIKLDPDSMSQKKSVEKMSLDFGISMHRLIESFKSCEDQYLYEETLAKIKNALGLPSRMGFLKEICTCLGNRREIVAVPSENQSSDLPDTGDGVKIEFSINLQKFELNKDSEYLVTPRSIPCSHSDIFRGSQELFNDPQFQYLEKRNLAWRTIVSQLDPEKFKTLELQNHHQISPSDISDFLNLDHNHASEIFEHLVAADTLSSCGSPLQVDIDLTNVQLSESIRAEWKPPLEKLIKQKCCYEIARLQLLQEIFTKTEVNVDGCHILEIRNVQENPIESFIKNAIQLDLIRNTRVKPRQDHSLSILTEQLTETGRAFMKTVAKEREQQNPTLHKEDIGKIYPDASDTFHQKILSQLRYNGWIDSNNQILLKLDQMGNLIKPQVTRANDITRYSFADVEPLIRLRLLEITKEMKTQLDQRLDELRGTLNTLEEPDAMLESLTDDTDGDPEYREEIKRFAASGFEHVISGTERRYTPRMMRNTLTILGIGTAQTVLGIFLGRDNYSGEGGALVASGLQDVFYAMYAFRTGRFRWAEWAKIKTIYIAILLLWRARKVGKGLLKKSARTRSALTSVVPQILVEFAKQEAYTQVCSYLESWVNTAVGMLSMAICTQFKGKIETSHRLEEALLQLASGMGAKEAFKVFSKCQKQAAKRVFQGAHSRKQFAEIHNFLACNILKPAMQKKNRAKIFGKGEFAQVMGTATSTLNAHLKDVLHAAGIPTLISTFVEEVEKGVRLDFEDWRKQAQTVDSEGQTETLILVPLEGSSKAEFLTQCRNEMIQGVNGTLESVVNSKLVQPLLEHGLRKVFSMGTRPTQRKLTKERSKTNHKENVNSADTHEMKIIRAEAELETRKVKRSKKIRGNKKF